MLFAEAPCTYGQLRRNKNDRPEPVRPRGRRAPIIELDDVTKVYPGGHMALDRVSLAIDRGEFVFLVGPTGCGKSTLIKMLIRELDADRGHRPDRRPRHRRPAGEEDPAAAAQHRHRLPGLQAAPQPHRLRQRRLRAAGDRRQPRRNPRAGAGDAAPGRPLDQAPQLSRTSSPAASSSASRSPAPSSTTRRCCSPTSPAATSTRSPRSGSCSCSTGSTRPARPSSSSPTTARWSTTCAAA